MKVGVRKFSVKKRLQAHSPITKAKRKYSVAKYIDPVGTAKKRVYNRVYQKTTVESPTGIIWGILGIGAVLGMMYFFIRGLF